MDLRLAVAAELRGRVRLGLATVSGVSVAERDPALLDAVEATVRELRDRYAGTAPAAIPELAPARRLYKALGLDPTKTRPSSEALLRRVLKGEPLHVVNTLVDAVNLASLRHQLPFGLYDLARVRPPVALRLGAEGEGYEGIRKGFVSLARRPLLADAQGPFGNPSSDSARTAISSGTREALVVAYAPAGGEGLATALDEAVGNVVRFCGGSRQERHLSPDSGA